MAAVAASDRTGAGRLVRSVALAAGAAALLWVALGVTLTLRKANPTAALTLWPWGAEPKVALAERALQQAPDGARRAEMARLARAALAREPVNAQAARSLAFAASFTDPAAAARAFAFAERLSRRDLPTELWLIENAVQRGDIRGALVHYDYALRTSRRSGDLLLPTLVAAADTPAVAEALGPFLRARPSWWRPFMLLAIEKSTNPATLGHVVAAFRPALSKPEEHEVARLAIARLADLRHYGLAASLYAQVTTGRSGRLAPLRDGEFDGAGDLTPIDWSLTDTADLGAAPDRAAGGDARLELHATDNAAGEVARQLLTLAPQQFRLTGVVGAGDTQMPMSVKLTVKCVDDVMLSDTLMPLTPAGRRFNLSFRVPPSCGAQWLLISVAGTGLGWIDKLALTPIR